MLSSFPRVRLFYLFTALGSVNVLVWIACFGAYFPKVNFQRAMSKFKFYSSDTVAQATDPSEETPNRYLTIAMSIPDKRRVDSDFKKTHLMTVTMRGQLGNHLFKFAALLGIAHRHGYSPVLPKSSHLHDKFLLPDFLSPRILQNSSDFKEHFGYGVYDYISENLTHDQNWTLHGFFQSHHYFSKFDKVIRRNFAFKEEIQKEADDILKSFNTSKVKVGVHVRRGNFLNAQKQGYSVVDENYLQRAMDYFRKKYKNVLFVVCSNDLKWCKSKLTRSDTVFVQKKPILDLAVLASCNHSVISSGTFSWWSGWLAGGDTVYYKNYPTPKSRLWSRFKASDYYPPNWVGML